MGTIQVPEAGSLEVLGIPVGICATAALGKTNVSIPLVV